jgi:hypothetical protein
MRRFASALVPCLALALPLLAAVPANAADTDIKINEVRSNPGVDFVELINTGSTSVDIQNWTAADSAAAPLVITTNSTVIAPGGLFTFEPNDASYGTAAFGLGASDSITIKTSGGTQVDTYNWTTHRTPSASRCPDSSGDLLNATTATQGAANECPNPYSGLVINEVESSGGTPGDWVELFNTTGSSIDLSGVVFMDSDPRTYAIPSGTSIAAGGYYVLNEAAFGFGLGGADSARIFRPGGSTSIASYSWTAHAGVTYGRCPNGSGEFANTKTATKEAANDCGPPFHGVETGPWPGSADVHTSDPEGAFTTEISPGDVSGLVWDANDDNILWAVKNKNRLFKLAKSGDQWVPVTSDGWSTGKAIRFANGSGEPDSEGVTTTPDGTIYTTTERDNTASGVPLNAVLRFDVSGSSSELVATKQWNLTADFPELAGLSGGSNLGFEGLTFVPDSYLVAGGFVDSSTGAAYDPADYPDHGGGLFFLGLENDGALYVYALQNDGTSHRVAVVPSGFPHVADVQFDPERQRVWAETDDTADGQSSLLEIGTDGKFAVEAGYDRPANLANLNNEGFAVAPQSTCSGGFKEAVWADDGDTDGHSLRSGTIECTPAQPQDVTFGTSAPTTPVVGQTYSPTATGGGSGNPIAITAAPASVCTVASNTVTFAHPGTCTVTAKQAAAPGWLAGSAAQSIEVGKAATGTAPKVTPSQLIASVAVTAPGAGTPTGSVEFKVDGTVVGTANLSGGTASLSRVVAPGADHTVSATYAGSADFTSSQGDLVRRDPLVETTVTGTQSSSGWYRSPVTVSFVCTPQGGILSEGCPGDAALSEDGADQSLSRTVPAVDGGSATATVDDIDIDRTKPTAKITGVIKDRRYVGSRPTPVCQASDALSGLASCKLARTITSTRTTITAKATDNAGNLTTATTSYRTLAYLVKDAPYKDGHFTLKRGTRYVVAGTVKEVGKVSAPFRWGSPVSFRALSGGSAPIRIPASAEPGSSWKVSIVVTGGSTHTLWLTAR